jgi:hypothetical protein
VKKERRKIAIMIDVEDYQKLETLANARRLKPCQLAREYIVNELQIDYQMYLGQRQALNKI